MGQTTTLDDSQPSSSKNLSILSREELEKVVELKEQEIQLLKIELEKYKLALRRLHLKQTPSIATNDAPGTVAKTDIAHNQTAASPKSGVDLSADCQLQLQNTVKKSEKISDSSPVGPGLLDDDLSSQSARSPEIQPIAVTSSSASGPTRMVFDSGTDDDDDNDELVPVADAPYISGQVDISEHGSVLDEVTGDNLHDVIQDIGEINLNMELRKERRKRRRLRQSASDCDRQNDEKQKDKTFNRDEASEVTNDDDTDEGDIDDDDDIISDGLLTSLTDAAISNLSQLAALQERCESQHHHYTQHTRSQLDGSRSQATEPQVSSASLFSSESVTNVPLGQVAIPTSVSSACLGSLSSAQIGQGRESVDSGFNRNDPFSPSNLANQAALAISAVAAAAAMQGSQQAILSNSPPSPLSSNASIHADLNSSQSLASVVAAAAVAAAAANNQQSQQRGQNPTHQIQPAQQARLISSALSSPEFYHNLQQQRSQSRMSPISSLHYTPSTSITPSTSSLLAHSRRSISNASSSFMSPIASPNYLRRQFIPDKLQLLSPSPGLASGSSSAASASLAHILHQQQHGHQPRSASALAGPISSQANTSLSNAGSTTISPMITNKNSSQARLNNMQIRHKFGYLGSGRGQFNSPHGFCLGLNQEIVVADTNNHRICIFDKSGTYITQFGSPGKDEGQLWNPRKVAILYRPSNGATTSGQTHKQQPIHSVSTYSSHFTSAGGIQNTSSGANQFTSDPLYVVCDRGAERSRMQLFTKEGVFVKKIGIHYIDIVAGLAITQSGLIIVVDSVSPTVYIINAETGTLNGWFDCSGHMKEPSDIAVKSDVPGNEYFICDFKGHCVVVFSEQGEYLRKIGQDGLTSYPNGIDISDDGDILVGDSHGNRFHVVVFDRNGNFVSQFECPHVKVSRCCGLKITREGYIVTLAKNNHHVLVLDTIHI